MPADSVPPDTVPADLVLAGPVLPTTAPGEAPPPLCVGDELAGADGLPPGSMVGLLEAEVVGVAFGLAVRLAVAVGLPQRVPAAGLADFPLEPALTWLVAVAVAVDVAVTPPSALEVAVGLACPVAWLVGELGGGLDGLGEEGEEDEVGEADAVADGLDVAVDVGEAAADDCGHDAIGVGW